MASGKRAIQFGSSALVAIVIAGAMVYSLSGTVKGWVNVLFWKGNDTLVCGGHMIMKLKGKEVDLNGTAILAGGECQLTLKDCTFKGTTPITAGGSAKVTIEGGTYTGSKTAITLGGNARVTIKGATLKGGTTGLSLRGTGTVTLEDVAVEGKTKALSASGNGRIEVIGGSLSSPKRAVYAAGSATVVLVGTKTEGAVYKRGNAVVKKRAK